MGEQTENGEFYMIPESGGKPIWEGRGGRDVTKETYEKDLRIVDEIVCKSGEALRVLDNEGNTKTATLRMIYWLAVAVWHLLDAEIRRRGDA